MGVPREVGRPPPPGQGTLRSLRPTHAACARPPGSALRVLRWGRPSLPLADRCGPSLGPPPMSTRPPCWGSTQSGRPLGGGPRALGWEEPRPPQPPDPAPTPTAAHGPGRGSGLSGHRAARAESWSFLHVLGRGWGACCQAGSQGLMAPTPQGTWNPPAPSAVSHTGPSDAPGLPALTGPPSLPTPLQACRKHGPWSFPKAFQGL